MKCFPLFLSELVLVGILRSISAEVCLSFIFFQYPREDSYSPPIYEKYRCPKHFLIFWASNFSSFSLSVTYNRRNFKVRHVFSLPNAIFLYPVLSSFPSPSRSCLNTSFHDRRLLHLFRLLSSIHMKILFSHVSSSILHKFPNHLKVFLDLIVY